MIEKFNSKNAVEISELCFDENEDEKSFLNGFTIENAFDQQMNSFICDSNENYFSHMPTDDTIILEKDNKIKDIKIDFFSRVPETPKIQEVVSDNRTVSDSNDKSEDSNQNEFLQKKIGRKPKSIAVKNEENSHSKYAFDNILRKIKVMFHQFIVSFLNGCIQKELVNPQQHLIKKLDGRKTQNITLTHNKELLFSSVRDCLVMFMSEKYKNITKEENKKNIEFLSNENPSIKAVLEMKYIDAYQKLFVNADIQCIEEKYHSILTMSPTLNTIVQDKLDSHEEDKYWKKLKEVAQCQFLNHFLNTKIRKPRINRKKN